MAGISTSLIGNKYINVNILNEIAARFTESTEKCLKTHETAADDDANSEGQHEFASFFVAKRFSHTKRDAKRASEIGLASRQSGFVQISEEIRAVQRGLIQVLTIIVKIIQE